MKNALISLDELLVFRKKLKQNNKKVVFTNGCFDILHAGHVDYCLLYTSDAADERSSVDLGGRRIIKKKNNKKKKQIKKNNKIIKQIKIREK